MQIESEILKILLITLPGVIVLGVVVWTGYIIVSFFRRIRLRRFSKKLASETPEEREAREKYWENKTKEYINIVKGLWEPSDWLYSSQYECIRCGWQYWMHEYNVHLKKCPKCGYFKFMMVKEYKRSSYKCTKCGKKVVNRIYVRGKERPRKGGVTSPPSRPCHFCGRRKFIEVNKGKA